MLSFLNISLSNTVEIYSSRAWWLMPIISVSSEVRRVTVQGQTRQKIREILSQQIIWACACHSSYVGGVGRRTVI
jgi:hypothetical protein